VNEVELLTDLVAFADQTYKLQLVALGIISVGLGWIAGHQR
jgi:hypothetical protein